MNPQSCDTMVALGNATTNGQTIFAKNSDRPADECQPLVQQPCQRYPKNEALACQFVTIPQVETTYRHIGSRPYWCWGYEHGFNEHQVVIGNEALSSHLPSATTPKLIGMELLRLGLERSRSAGEAVEVMTDLITRYGQGKFDNAANVRTYDNGYIVADPHEAYVIETAGHDWAVKRVERTLGISNVYSVTDDWVKVSPTVGHPTSPTNRTGRFNFAEAYTATSRSEGSGAMRRQRSCALLGMRAGGIDARTMMTVLSDHGDGQQPERPLQSEIARHVSICMHPNQVDTWGNTAASLVADLCGDGSRLPVYWCSFYSPCLSVFFPIFSEGQLPNILTQGDATPNLASPWWRFHRLTQLAVADQQNVVPLVRSHWQALQDDFFATAYHIAQSNRQLMDEGHGEIAQQNLTRYMCENVERVLSKAAELIAEIEG